MNSLPPLYRTSSARPPLAPVPSNDLPPYSRRNTYTQQPHSVNRQLTEHLYRLNDGKLSLKIFSSAKSSKSLPTFFEKENITGQLDITAERGDSINAIFIMITGRVITGSCHDDSFVFLNHVVPVWAKAPNAPRLPSPSEGASGPKLLGHCTWPVSIALPRTVDVPSGTGDIRTCKLPETFLERHTRASVQYELCVHISRGKLRTDSEIRTAFGYVACTRPEPPSLLRQLAYQQGCPLPGPSTDPDGWKTLRPVVARGSMFRSRRVDARCTLSIAKPLCFTRGTVIPCSLTIEGSDADALDAFSMPSSIVVCLRRRVRFYNKNIQSQIDVAWNEDAEEAGTAVWWPSTTMQSSTHIRHLEGEIRLPKDLRPSSDMGHFSISYSVALCQFDMAGFQPDSTTTLVSEPVEIATMHARGPRVMPYSPPAYDPISISRRHEDRFNVYMVGQVMVA